MHSSTIPQRKRVLAVYDMREATGWGAPRISRATGVPQGSVSLWLKKPQTFDPYYDPIAIERALKGDAAVYDRLTAFEHKLVVALLERADTKSEPSTKRFPESHQDKVQRAIERRRHRVLHAAPNPKHWKIAERKLEPGICAKAKSMRQKGIDFAIIGRQLGLSRSSVYRALRAAS